MKNAQIKIQQMSFMLITVTLFFVLALMFILTIKFSGLKESATELQEKNAMLLVSKLANSPEFSCEASFGKNKINCIDEDKVMMLKENIKKYENFWGVSNIEIRRTFPKMSSERICNLENYPDCNIIKVYNKNLTGFDASSFVSLCRKENSGSGVYDKCEIAKMMVSYD